jgi:hypothetical protein
MPDILTSTRATIVAAGRQPGHDHQLGRDLKQQEMAETPPPPVNQIDATNNLIDTGQAAMG